MSDKDTLVSFGFSEDKVQRALAATKHGGLQPALDWLEQHQDEHDEAQVELNADDAEAKVDEGDHHSTEEGEAKSLVCLQCGKKFRNAALASYHGDKSGHDQFEESTDKIAPLTEEEKAAKLSELRQKMVEKRAARARQEAEEGKQNEALRRRAGQEQNEFKERMKVQQAVKDAERRKQEKLDDAKARARIKEQIEADKRERAAKLAAGKAVRAGQTAPQNVAQSGPSAAAIAKVSDGSKISAFTRLQLRLPNGRPPLTTTVESSATLQSVENWLRAEQGYSATEIQFSTTFPRKIFTQQEKTKTMIELGLSPSSALVIL